MSFKDYLQESYKKIVSSITRPIRKTDDKTIMKEIELAFLLNNEFDEEAKIKLGKTEPTIGDKDFIKRQEFEAVGDLTRQKGLVDVMKKEVTVHFYK